MRFGPGCGLLQHTGPPVSFAGIPIQIFRERDCATRRITCRNPGNSRSDSPERYGEAPRLLQRNTPLRTAFMPQTKIVFFADQQTDQTRFRLFSTDFRRKFHHNGTCFTKIAVT